MTASRSRKQIKTNKKTFSPHNRQKLCPFCEPSLQKDKIVQETKHFRVIPNIYPYSLWDSQKVADHLMIIPKNHTEKLGSLTSGAGDEYLNLIDKYEDRGYSLYARAPKSVMKTVSHHHTHLIKPMGKMRRFVLYVRKPYVRWHF